MNYNNNQEKPYSIQVIVKSEFGIHARPAARIAKLAEQATQNVWLVRNEDKVDATSIIDILSLGCTKGTIIKVEIENKNDYQVLESINMFFESCFGDDLNE